jgi:hypothetical protein
VAATIALAKRGVSLVIADLPADELLKATDEGAPRKVSFLSARATIDCGRKTAAPMCMGTDDQKPSAPLLPDQILSRASASIDRVGAV